MINTWNKLNNDKNNYLDMLLLTNFITIIYYEP